MAIDKITLEILKNHYAAAAESMAHFTARHSTSQAKQTAISLTTDGLLTTPTSSHVNTHN